MSKKDFWDWDAFCGNPFIKKEHRQFQEKCRVFVDAEIIPHIADWEAAGDFPDGLQEKCFQAGLFGALWPAAYGGTSPTAEQADPYFFFILADELARASAGGIYASVFTHTIGLPPILSAGSEEQKRSIARDIITAKKNVCLAVTEASGGSDVANLQTTAVRQDGHYVVNGVKMFISGGTKADYFTTAVRTGGPGARGVSLLLIPRHLPGVQVTRLETQGWNLSSTTTVAFNDVKVPVSNLLGKENEGFLHVMKNFTNERLFMAIQSCRMARTCLEEAAQYAKSRKTFGKTLVEHQVIRHKIMEMARHVMSTHGMIMTILEKMQAGINVAGAVALAKVQSTKAFEFCAREASQVVGGRSYLKNGKGSVIERLYREVRVYAIGGGSEEIMLDLASRQSNL